MLVRWAWVAAAVVGIPGVAWFAAYEHELGKHLLRSPLAPQRPEGAITIPFGTEFARASLESGWSGDERWNGRFPFVWAEGLTSTLRIPPLAAQAHHLRLRANPFLRGGGLSCQVVAVDFNGTRIGRVLLDRGWNDYELEIPGRLIRPVQNEMEFRYGYAHPPSRRDTRRLAVAFQLLEIFAEGPRGTASH